MPKKYDDRLFEARLEPAGEFAAVTEAYVASASDLLLHPIMFLGQLAAGDLTQSAAGDGPVCLGNTPVNRASIFLKPGHLANVAGGDSWPTSWLVQSDISGSQRTDQPEVRLDEIRVTPNRLEHGAAERFDTTVEDTSGADPETAKAWRLVRPSIAETNEIKTLVQRRINPWLLQGLRAQRRRAALRAVELIDQQAALRCPVQRQAIANNIAGLGRQVGLGLPRAVISTLSELKMIS